MQCSRDRSYQGNLNARTDRFISQSVGGDVPALRGQMSSRRVVLELPDVAASTFAGQAILFTLLNLMVRLDAYCPFIDVRLAEDVPRHPLIRLLEGGSLAGSLRAFFAPFPAASGRLSFSAPDPSPATADVRVRIAPAGSDAAAHSVWADGWIAYWNAAPVPPAHTECAAGTDDVPNAVGAHVAAGLAAAEVFKRLLLKAGVAKAVPVDSLVFSAFDYRLADDGPNPPLPDAVDLEGVALVGAGGIGAAFAAAASALPGISGAFDIVDRDALDEEGTNLNRHLVSRPGDEGKVKVSLCRRALAFHGGVRVHETWYDDYARVHGVPGIAIVGVDKDPVRREIQESLPRLVLNAGTSDTGGFQVTRHDFLVGACLSCIARADLQQDHPAERSLAARLGLSLEDVFRYQESGEPVPESVLRAGGKLPAESLGRFAGKPLAEIRMGACADVMLADGPQEEAVSVSFLSALPGFLLLGEVIRARHFPGSLYPAAAIANAAAGRSNHSALSVLGVPNDALLRSWRAKREGCDCTRDAYRNAYARRWPEATVGAGE